MLLLIGDGIAVLRSVTCRVRTTAAHLTTTIHESGAGGPGIKSCLALYFWTMPARTLTEAPLATIGGEMARISMDSIRSDFHNFVSC